MLNSHIVISEAMRYFKIQINHSLESGECCHLRVGEATGHRFFGWRYLAGIAIRVHCKESFEQDNLAGIVVQNNFVLTLTSNLMAVFIDRFERDFDRNPPISRNSSMGNHHRLSNIRHRHLDKNGWILGVSNVPNSRDSLNFPNPYTAKKPFWGA